MLSPIDANSTIGDLMSRRSKGLPPFIVAPPVHTLLPTKRLRVIHSISSLFIR